MTFMGREIAIFRESQCKRNCKGLSRSWLSGLLHPAREAYYENYHPRGFRLCKDVPSPGNAASLSCIEYLEGAKGVRRRTPFLIAGAIIRPQEVRREYPFTGSIEYPEGAKGVSERTRTLFFAALPSLIQRWKMAHLIDIARRGSVIVHRPSDFVRSAVFV
jgi:hypothetical protein